MPQHPLSLSQNCLVWLRLSVSARSPSIGKTDQKGTDGCCVLLSSSRQTDSQLASQRAGRSVRTLRHCLVFQLFGSGGKHIRGHCAACRIPVTPTPSENIIDLEIKQAARLQIGFRKCLILPVRFFRRPDAFLHPPPPTTKSRLMLRTRPSQLRPPHQIRLINIFHVIFKLALGACSTLIYANPQYFAVGVTNFFANQQFWAKRGAFDTRGKIS